MLLCSDRSYDDFWSRSVWSLGYSKLSWSGQFHSDWTAGPMVDVRSHMSFVVTLNKLALQSYNICSGSRCRHHVSTRWWDRGRIKLWESCHHRQKQKSVFNQKNTTARQTITLWAQNKTTDSPWMSHYYTPSVRIKKCPHNTHRILQ